MFGFLGTWAMAVRTVLARSSNALEHQVPDAVAQAQGAAVHEGGAHGVQAVALAGVARHRRRASAAAILPAVPLLKAVALAAQAGIGKDFRRLDGPGFVGFDVETDRDETTLSADITTLMTSRLAVADLHPDVWPVVAIRDPNDTAARLSAVAGDKYSYRELDQFTDVIKRTLQNVPQVAKVTRSGVLPEEIYLEYGQARLAASALRPSTLLQILAGRNTTAPGGLISIAGRGLLIDPSGEFASEKDIGNVIVGQSGTGRPVYLRDSVDILRGYQTPARYLNYHTTRQPDGTWRRARAVTVSLQMRPGEQISAFGEAVDAALARLAPAIPSDLILARPSDQPLQVRENVGLFMSSLYEAIGLVVLVALIGFWEWRSALLMALAIPLTLALTFVFMYALGIDLQQVSIASLIIALGLLVDDPVVAGDAIKRGLNSGLAARIAAWLGPTRLATAILFATVTNIVAYLPLLMLSGNTGEFIYSLPVVLACSLVASRITSMTFVPLLGYYLLRPTPAGRAKADPRGGLYYRVAHVLLDHRWITLAAAILLLALGGYGIVSVAGHLVGRQIRAMIDASLAGRNAEAAAIHHRLTPLIDMLFIESNPIPVKYAVGLAGIAAGDCRLPLVPPSDSAQTLLRAELARHGVPVTEFRAAIIIGSGSASFEMLRHLTERLPVMITPRWVATRCQPIAIRDVLDYLVGAVVFIILVVIQFVVITNGAGRIAEVAARFTLDAMPGKQMAIDADLNAGIIDENVARARRADVAAEADFYGAMDGGSKFVKGDAIAAIIIVVIAKVLLFFLPAAIIAVVVWFLTGYSLFWAGVAFLVVAFLSVLRRK